MVLAGLGIALGQTDRGMALVAQVRQWVTRSPDSGVLGREVKPDEPEEGKPAGSRRLRELVRLRENASAKVIAEARDVTVDWNADRTQIQTSTRLKIVETLDGQVPPEVTVAEPGGEIDGVGLAVSHPTTWQPGERAFVLLGQRGGRYHVVGGERGKFRLEGRRIPELNLSVEEAVDVAKTGRITSDRDLAAAAAPPEPGGGRLGAAFVLLPYKWTSSTSSTIPYRVNVAGQPANLNSESFVKAVTAAFASWASPTGNAVALSYQGTTTTAATANDGQNVIFWAPIDTPGVLGQALCWYNPRTGATQDCDVVFDPLDYPWSAADQPGLNTIDFQSVALHEFGHFLGLNHSADPAAVMFPSIALGTVKRVPAGDDLSGLTSLYSAGPATTPAAVPTAPPRTLPANGAYLPLIRQARVER